MICKKLTHLCFLIAALSLPSITLADGCISVKGSQLKFGPLNAKGKCAKNSLQLSVLAANGITGATGATGANGATGATGATGANGTARAFAFVKSTGEVDATRSSATVTSRKVGTGVYCVKVTSILPTQVLPLVTADFRDGAGSFHIAQVDSTPIVGTCNADEFLVRTYNESSGSFASSDLGFSFLVP